MMADFGIMVNILPIAGIVFPVAMQAQNRQASPYSMMSILFSIAALVVALNDGFFKNPSGLTSALVTVSLVSLGIAVYMHFSHRRGRNR